MLQSWPKIYVTQMLSHDLLVVAEFIAWQVTASEICFRNRLFMSAFFGVSAMYDTCWMKAFC